jgi:2-iminobutanoate/2-iminopropanoate deaminase
MNSKVILTSQAPQPIGPYSQAIQAGNFLFCSGQIALDPHTGQLVGQDVETQTRQIMANLEAVLREAGCDFSHVVKTTVFLKSLADFPQLNEIYSMYFRFHSPARTTIEVSRLPKDALVEIELIAIF